MNPPDYIFWLSHSCRFHWIIASFTTRSVYGYTYNQPNRSLAHLTGRNRYDRWSGTVTWHPPLHCQNFDPTLPSFCFEHTSNWFLFGIFLSFLITHTLFILNGLAFLDLFPDASVFFLGLFREKVSLEPIEYYQKLPKVPTVDTVFLLDPILATGQSLPHRHHQKTRTDWYFLPSWNRRDGYRSV